MGRILRNGEEDDGLFDLRFWQKIGPEGIFSAAWEMVNEVNLFKGGHGSQSRLQRSITRVIRSKG